MPKSEPYSNLTKQLIGLILTVLDGVRVGVLRKEEVRVQSGHGEDKDPKLDLIRMVRVEVW